MYVFIVCRIFFNKALTIQFLINDIKKIFLLFYIKFEIYFTYFIFFLIIFFFI